MHNPSLVRTQKAAPHSSTVGCKQTSNMKNPELRDALQALTQKSLDVIKKSIDSNLVITTESGWVKQDDDTYVRQDIKRPIWGIVFHNAKVEIESTKEFTNFSEIVSADQNISSHLETLVGTFMGRSRFQLDDLIFKPLSPFLKDTGIIAFDESVFEAEYSKIERDLYSTDIEFERLTPLCGFSTDSPDIVLGPNLSIVKLSESEITQLLSLGIKIGESFGPENFIHHMHQFAIKLTYCLPKVIGDEKIEGSVESHNPYIKGDTEQDILNALRLFKEGKVYPINTVTKSKSIFFAGVSYNFGSPARSFMRNKFQLTGSEKDSFVEFWKLYQGTTIPQKHFLSVAIRRFSQANERDSVEDKIIDYLISAEALFLSSGGSFQGELKYRLSHRAAMFIESETEKQRNIFKFMQKAYDVRSAIVHGATPKLPKKEDDSQFTLEEFCQDVENYLRFSLNKAIELASTAEAPNKILDWDKVVFPDDN